MTERVYILVGPTAVGKSEIALRIAEKLGAWIISADSRQVYKGMDIGTAKPSETERARVRHFLVDVADPDYTFSAADFLSSVHDILRKASEQRRIVLVVGGTGLYVRALVKGFNLANTPRINEIHNELTAKFESDGLESLVKELEELDPKAAKAIELKNPRRVIRALEIIKATGKPIDEVRGACGPDEFEFIVIGLKRNRESLNERIRLRTYAMIHSGWIEEVRELMERKLHTESPAMTGIGYKEIREYLDGKITLDLAIEKIVIRTRQFAKRQMTWFSAEDYISWIDLESDDEQGDVAEKILDLFYEKSMR